MKICMYGGTFDPPHIGHVHACKSFLEKFTVDKFYIVPTYIPPHKTRNSNVSASERMNMARIAFSDIADNIEISDIELKRQGKSYTADTLEQFKQMGCDEIYLLCGTDMFVTLDQWYNSEYIFKAAIIVCMRRENDAKMSELINRKSELYTNKYDAKIKFINKAAIDISSTDIRQSVSNLKTLLPEAVYTYIKNNNLYEIENL